MNNLEEQIKTYLEDFTGFNIQQEHPQPPSNKSTERDLL